MSADTRYQLRQQLAMSRHSVFDPSEVIRVNLVFLCPECKGKASMDITEEEVADVKSRIAQDGRSPTVIVKCENGHDLLVTLYNMGDGLGVRDIVVAMAKTEVAVDKTEVSEIDWLKKAFGGEQ